MTSNQPIGTRGPEAVVWVDERHAIVARTGDEGGITTIEVRRAVRPEHRFLADVVHEIGNRERVMIVGPSTPRLALEREYVMLSHRPERLIAGPVAARGSGTEILERLERLAA